MTLRLSAFGWRADEGSDALASNAGRTGETEVKMPNIEIDEDVREVYWRDMRRRPDNLLRGSRLPGPARRGVVGHCYERVTTPHSHGEA